MDVLIHNAAAFDVRAKTRHMTEEGIESIWATNHLGPFALTGTLLPLFRKDAGARIVNVGSLSRPRFACGFSWRSSGMRTAKPLA